MRWLVYISALVGALMLPALPAASQTYPSRPVRVIASSGAGGLSDVFMRVLGEELHKRWGQPVIVENRPGGNFNIGLRACADAPPDGHTICLLSNEPVTYNIYMYPNLPFSIEKGIVPVTNLFFITQVLAVNSDLKAGSLKELIARVKERPKTYSYSAPAAPLILFLENLNKDHGIDLVRVPFKGGGDAINGVLSGITPIVFLGAGNMMAHLKSGRMTALMVDGERRSPLLPDVQTVAEFGYGGPVTRSYFGFYAPAGMPPDMIRKVADDVRAIASEPAFIEKNFTARGLEPALNTPEAFAAFLVKDRASARQVVERSGLKPH